MGGGRETCYRERKREKGRMEDGDIGKEWIYMHACIVQRLRVKDSDSNSDLQDSRIDYNVYRVQSTPPFPAR